MTGCPDSIHHVTGKVWTCSSCRLPHKQYHNAFVTRCDDCLDPFSSPWENVCKKCHDLEYMEVKLVEGRIVAAPVGSAPPYKGWEWGRLAQRTYEASRGW